jgi:hypothetical protein
MNKDTRAPIELEIDILTRSPNEADSIVFVPSFLAKFSLPNNQQQAQEFVRKNGTHNLVIVAVRSVGLPYGIYPRLILIFLATNVRIYREKTIFLGDSLAGFKNKLGVGVSGGKNGPTSRFNDQYKRLFTASLKYYNDSDTIFDVTSINFARKAFSVFDSSADIKGAIELEHSFYEDILHKSFPADSRIVKLFRKNCLALDIYFFLTLRFFSLRSTTRISYFQLNDQFGSNILKLKNFKPKFVKALLTVQRIIPQYKVILTDTGIILYPSKPHVTSRG